MKLINAILLWVTYAHDAFQVHVWRNRQAWATLDIVFVTACIQSLHSLSGAHHNPSFLKNLKRIAACYLKAPFKRTGVAWSASKDRPQQIPWAIGDFKNSLQPLQRRSNS